jgi:phage shock protein C
MDLALTQRWWRSENSGIMAGVCEGIGEKFAITPWVIRILWLASVLFLGTGLLLYIFAAVSFPRKDRLIEAEDKVFLGVCQNLALKLETSPEILRFSCLVLAFASFGATLIVYFILAFTLPKPQLNHFE